MKNQNKIIVFANQKGGVGKTTLCILYANYLHEQGYPLCVIDCDMQQTIFQTRQFDENNLMEEDDVIPYSVQAFSIKDPKDVAKMIQKAKEIPGTVLIDAPGNIAQEGLVPIFVGADVIVTPYQYEKGCIGSTSTFLKVINMLQATYEDMNPEIILVPNRIDTRIGTKAELSTWSATDSLLAGLGKIVKSIRALADIQRYNTLQLLPSQKKAVEPTFKAINKIIYPKSK